MNLNLDDLERIYEALVNDMQTHVEFNTSQEREANRQVLKNLLDRISYEIDSRSTR